MLSCPNTVSTGTFAPSYTLIPSYSSAVMLLHHHACTLALSNNIAQFRGSGNPEIFLSLTFLILVRNSIQLYHEILCCCILLHSLEVVGMLNYFCMLFCLHIMGWSGHLYSLVFLCPHTFTLTCTLSFYFMFSCHLTLLTSCSIQR